MTLVYVSTVRCLTLAHGLTGIIFRYRSFKGHVMILRNARGHCYERKA